MAKQTGTSLGLEYHFRVSIAYLKDLMSLGTFLQSSNFHDTFQDRRFSLKEEM